MNNDSNHLDNWRVHVTCGDGWEALWDWSRTWRAKFLKQLADWKRIHNDNTVNKKRTWRERILRVDVDHKKLDASEIKQTRHPPHSHTVKSLNPLKNFRHNQRWFGKVRVRIMEGEIRCYQIVRWQSEGFHVVCLCLSVGGFTARLSLTTAMFRSILACWERESMVIVGTRTTYAWGSLWARSTYWDQWNYDCKQVCHARHWPGVPPHLLPQYFLYARLGDNFKTVLEKKCQNWRVQQPPPPMALRQFLSAFSSRRPCSLPARGRAMTRSLSVSLESG